MLQENKTYLPTSCPRILELRETFEGLREMFEGDSANTCTGYRTRIPRSEDPHQHERIFLCFVIQNCQVLLFYLYRQLSSNKGLYK